MLRFVRRLTLSELHENSFSRKADNRSHDSQNNAGDDKGEAEPDRRDSQLQPPSTTTTTKAADIASLPQSPPKPLLTSCFGHFDRLDLEYTPIPGERTVVLYWDSDGDSTTSSIKRVAKQAANQEAHVTRFRKAASSDVIVISDGEVSGRSPSEDAEGETDDDIELPVRTQGVGNAKPATAAAAADAAGSQGSVDVAWENDGYTNAHDDVSSMRDKGKERAIDDAGNTTTTNQENAAGSSMDGATGEAWMPRSPGGLLTYLEVSENTVTLSEAEDVYFAGRLASACVILIRDGLIGEASRLGQWSVNLVGKELWDRMVMVYASEARDDNDDERWVRYILGEVVLVLGKMDATKSAELQQMVVGWQAAGILPGDA